MGVEIVYETHATTTYNEAGIATGWLPGELSESGRAQARELGARRRDDGIDAVASYSRARPGAPGQVSDGCRAEATASNSPPPPWCGAAVSETASGAMESAPDTARAVSGATGAGRGAGPASAGTRCSTGTGMVSVPGPLKCWASHAPSFVIRTL
ncbi:histidine phosphatase family protein [Streptomyces sp. T028]|uniref:histidine phosphatase family protein n=1 Tax=Streptomyces sp. T028 TaxID=3394379 RepID=UPI003A8C7666